MGGQNARSRGRFLQFAGAAGFGAMFAPRGPFARHRYLAPVRVDDPPADYPSRDWARIYRGIDRADKSFVFLCRRNDTHNCLLNAFVKNKVVAQTYAGEPGTNIRSRKATTRT